MLALMTLSLSVIKWLNVLLFVKHWSILFDSFSVPLDASSIEYHIQDMLLKLCRFIENLSIAKLL